jgi:hypothetical protein
MPPAIFSAVYRHAVEFYVAHRLRHSVWYTVCLYNTYCSYMFFCITLYVGSSDGVHTAAVYRYSVCTVASLLSLFLLSDALCHSMFFCITLYVGSSDVVHTAAVIFCITLYVGSSDGVHTAAVYRYSVSAVPPQEPYFLLKKGKYIPSNHSLNTKIT